MGKNRVEGQEQPGWNWGPFTLRVPFYHVGVAWPEFAQGIFVAGATGLGLIPLLQAYFGLSFEQALALIFIQTVLLCSSPLLFGEPYAPGWITPALPLALTFVLALTAEGVAKYPTPEEKFQFMTAVSINFALIVFILGITGLGAQFVRRIPDALKGGIILGAAIAAIKRVYIDDAERFLFSQPFATVSAIAVCLALTFSLPLQRYKAQYPIVAKIAGLGLLPGFAIAAIVGPLAGEIRFELHTDAWLLIPPFVEVWGLVTPFAIGWPSLEMFVEGMFLAIPTYIILFGDIVTGNEIVGTAQRARKDEKIHINETRTHYSVAIRNALMAVFAPFFPTQGVLWAGVQVIIVQRWAEGKKAFDSLFTGIASYYFFGVPILYLINPLVRGLEPLMGIALSLTLIMTGFACAYIAMGITRTPIERGVALLTAMTLALYAERPWVGILVGIVATIILIGIKPHAQEEAPPAVQAMEEVEAELDAKKE